MGQTDVSVGKHVMIATKTAFSSEISAIQFMTYNKQ